MPINRDTSWAYLDRKMCFDAWNSSSSVSRAAKKLEKDGVRNPATGRPPTRMGVWVAAMRYMTENPEEARYAIINAGGDWAHDQCAYYKWLVARAASAMTDGTWRKWIWEAKLSEYVPDELQHLLQ